MDLNTLVMNMMRDGYFRTLTRDPLAQFGVQSKLYLGAELLPERDVEENMYREYAIRYRTVIANSGTRYSPTQKKGGDLFGSFEVELGESDIARELDAQQYDMLLKLLGRQDSIKATAEMITFVDTVINNALVEYNEKQRWDAIVSAQVVRVGHNNYTETVNYSNPTGHRANAGGAWSDNTYDPMDDIIARAELLASKGYNISRIFCGRPVYSKMALNAKMRSRVGLTVVNPSGQITAVQGRATLDAINGELDREGLPKLELYDQQYRTQTGTGFFLARNAFVMVSTTGQPVTVDQGDKQRILHDTLGYTAIGRAAGQPSAGRVARMEAKDNKPPRVEAEGWQTSLPVITEPEAIAVITGVS